MVKGLTLSLLLVLGSILFGPGGGRQVAAATCSGSTGPGIPPPAGLPAGVTGFHAQWYGQSGYPTLCPGQRSTATVAYYNSGSRGWVSGTNRLGETAYLGTWGPEPGQDRASTLADVTVKPVPATAASGTTTGRGTPLDQPATADHAYAAIHGTYLCPPDYAECAGKVNSYDYAMWSSDLGAWINKPALIGQNGLVIFNGKTPTYYRRAYVYGQGPTANLPITAGITMFMLLLQGGAILDISAEQTAKQQEREMKGPTGTVGTILYLA